MAAHGPSGLGLKTPDFCRGFGTGAGGFGATPHRRQPVRPPQGVRFRHNQRTFVTSLLKPCLDWLPMKNLLRNAGLWDRSFQMGMAALALVACAPAAPDESAEA